MATKVHMEALSPTMEEGQIVKWLKSEGEDVVNGDILAEIETDKATMELVARGDGTLRKILLDEGGTAPVGNVIAVIAGADEDISDLVSGAGAGGAAAAADASEEPEPKDEKKAEAEGEPEAAEADRAEDPADAEAKAAPSDAHPDRGADREADQPTDQEADGRIKASPVARRLASEEGIPLQRIEGSGPAGRIVKRDVEQAAREGSRKAPTEAPIEPGEEYRDVPLTQMRKTIAKRLVESIGPVPHFFLTVDVDMTRAVEARRRINALLEKDESSDGIRVSFNDIVLKATALALRKHPECNAHWRDDHIRQFNRVHLGVAVAIAEGLITPIVRDAHAKGMAQIAREVRELAGRAREKKLKPEEYTGATFSVSNLGMFGIEEFTAVINPPEAGILAVGALEERPVVEDGEVRVRSRMKITMSCDHRVIDGAQGSRFLQTLTGILEEPLVALL